MNCNKCQSDLIISIGGKTGDLNNACFKNLEHQGYNPPIAGICEGDYINFNFCANCGFLQGFKPLTEADIVKAFKEIGCEIPSFIEIKNVKQDDTFFNKFRGNDVEYMALEDAKESKNKYGSHWEVEVVGLRTKERLTFIEGDDQIYTIEE